jgi:hypothetical protein
MILDNQHLDGLIDGHGNEDQDLLPDYVDCEEAVENNHLQEACLVKRHDNRL